MSSATRLRSGVGHRLLICIVLSACVTLACSTRPSPGPEGATRPDRPRESTLPGLRTDLARIVGRESVERGDTLLRMFRERGFDPHIQEFPNTATDRESRGIGRNLRPYEDTGWITASESFSSTSRRSAPSALVLTFRTRTATESQRWSTSTWSQAMVC